MSTVFESGEVALYRQSGVITVISLPPPPEARENKSDKGAEIGRTPEDTRADKP